MSNIITFQEEHPSLESYWRSVILFGRNVASYKFALAKSLLELSKEGKTEISLEVLAEPFSNHLCKHLKHSPKQATSNSSKFLEICSKYNNNNVTYDELVNVTKRLGFNNVIDAFHIVANEEIPIKFYEKDYSAQSKKIILTDEIFKLQELESSLNFMPEIESRWNLVEKAWELNISKNLLMIEYDDKLKSFFVNDTYKRKDITSSRGALNGYQKGKCFYCFDDISIITGSDKLCNVDHFFPHTLQRVMPKVNLNGVWNLVLACKSCNRGSGGKFEKIPMIKYLERLNKRNEFLISSHHPLKETIINQTGTDIVSRRSFLQMIDKNCINYIIHRWEVESKGKELF